MSRRVHRHVETKKFAFCGLFVNLFIEIFKSDIGNGHAVLCERTSFVCANDSGSSHSFASVHASHEVVGLHHRAHAVGQAQSDTHGQTFRHSHHNDSDSNHDFLQEIAKSVRPFEMRESTLSSIDDGATHDDKECNAIAHLCNHIGKTIQLLVEWSFHTVVYLCSFKHATIFGLVTHFFDNKSAVSIEDGCSTAHLVGMIGGLRVKVFGMSRLLHQRLSSERRFVDLQRDAFYKRTIGWHLFSAFKKNNISHYQIGFEHLANFSITQPFVVDIFVDLIENFKFFFALEFEIEGHTGS